MLLYVGQGIEIHIVFFPWIPSSAIRRRCAWAHFRDQIDFCSLGKN